MPSANGERNALPESQGSKPASNESIKSHAITFIIDTHLLTSPAVNGVLKLVLLTLIKTGISSGFKERIASNMALLTYFLYTLQWIYVGHTVLTFWWNVCFTIMAKYYRYNVVLKWILPNLTSHNIGCLTKFSLYNPLLDGDLQYFRGEYSHLINNFGKVENISINTWL